LLSKNGTENTMMLQADDLSCSGELIQRNNQKIAIIINGNARSVNESVLRQLSSVIQEEDLYISRSLDQGKFIARHIINKKYDVVFCGGGDGTFTRCVTDIMQLRPKRPPVFGVLRLGTGNALAQTLGSSPVCIKGLAADLHLARAACQPFDLPLLRVEGALTPFAGVGLDALILEDYNRVKSCLEHTPVPSLGKGPLGYALAVATRSLWRFVLEAKPTVLIRNEGAPTQRMDLQGHAFGPIIGRGGILYQGPVAIAAASTVPYYGLGLKLFPQAMLRRDRFQLRVGYTEASKLVAHLPALFRGQFADDRIFDYFCTAVSIHLCQPFPLQLGGDEVGRRSEVNISLAMVQAVGRPERSESWPMPTGRPDCATPEHHAA
jgi:diacylglycerol kinase family enzyme